MTSSEQVLEQVEAAAKRIYYVYSSRTVEAAARAVLEFYDVNSHIGPIPRKTDRFLLGQHVLWAIEMACRKDRESAASKAASVPETVAPTVTEQSEAGI